MHKGSSGPKHYKWREGIGRHEMGYYKVRVGRSHPLADRNGWTYMHRLVWAAAGRSVRPGTILHHLNGDKIDNRLENLQEITRAEHNRIHNREKSIDPCTGRFIGKKAAGRLLDGVEHNAFPEVQP